MSTVDAVAAVPEDSGAVMDATAALDDNKSTIGAGAVVDATAALDDNKSTIGANKGAAEINVTRAVPIAVVPGTEDDDDEAPELFLSGSEESFDVRRRALPISEREIFSSSSESETSETEELGGHCDDVGERLKSQAGQSGSATPLKGRNDTSMKAMFSIDDNPFEYLRSVRAEAAGLSGALERPSESATASTTCMALRGKPVCKYVRHLLHRAGRAQTSESLAAAPTAVMPHQRHAEEVWRDRVVEYFEKFREHLVLAAEELPNLSGECSLTGYQAIERDWAPEYWDGLVTTRMVSVDLIGVMDSVRSSIVLGAVARALCNLNSTLVSSAAAGSQPHVAAPKLSSDSCSPQRAETVAKQVSGEQIAGETRVSKVEGIVHSEPIPVAPAVLSTGCEPQVVAEGLLAAPLKLTRPLQWCFAALASLDSLQALEADVAANLQVIRRCCRWLRNNVCSAPGTYQVDMQNSLQVVEIIIVEYFNQK